MTSHTDTSPAAAILTALADHYEKHPESWRRDGLRMNESFCILHGLERFGDNAQHRNNANYRLHQVLNNRMPKLLSAAAWNDCIAKDVHEVISVLREAAAL